MIPNLLDDLLRAWDTKTVEGETEPQAVVIEAQAESPQQNQFNTLEEQDFEPEEAGEPAAVAPEATVAQQASPMDALLSNLLTSFEEPPLPETLKPHLVREPVLSKYVAVSLGRHKFALPVESVVEAGRYPRTTSVPGLPSYVRGVFSFRGEVLPVIDVHVLAGNEPLANPADARILTIQSDDRKSAAAFAFDSLEGIINLDSEPRQTPVKDVYPLAQLLAGVAGHNGAVYGLLLPQRLLRESGCLEDSTAAA